MPFRPIEITLPAVRRAALVLFFTCLAMLGCQPAEQISKYTAPKDPADVETISDEPVEGEAKVRILGAIAEAGKPGEENWYFFKFQPPQSNNTYPPKAIERHAADFEAFLKSLKFADDGKPTWSVPAGWRAVEVKTQFGRLATLRSRKSETIVDLAITENTGSLINNINRWRVQQAGIEAITEAQIPTKCRVLTIDGRKVVVVDVSGPGGKGGMMPPFTK